MPPRFAYWTILIDNAPTAFRARDLEELLPTVNQLKRKNENVIVKWFSGGELWDSPEQARETRLSRKPKVVEKRGHEWRPGGQHKDPRARFDKKQKKDRPRDRDRPNVAQPFRAAGPSDRPRKPFGKRPFGPKKPWAPGARPWSGPPRGPKPSGGDRRFAKPHGAPKPRSGEGGWQNRERPRGPRPPFKPAGPRREWRKPDKKRNDDE